MADIVLEAKLVGDIEGNTIIFHKSIDFHAGIAI